MNEPSYEVATSTDALCFDFESISAEKIIQKQVRFTAFPDAPTVFNMALIDIVNGGTDSDLTVSNNQDMRKVLATVGKCLIAFFDIYPRAVVVFSGSTQVADAAISCSHYPKLIIDRYCLGGAWFSERYV
jgi:hypothetical protein